MSIIQTNRYKKFISISDFSLNSQELICIGVKDTAVFLEMKLRIIWLNWEQVQLKIPISHAKNEIKQIGKQNWLIRWQSSPNGRTTFSFIPGYPPKHFTDNFLRHQVTQILTGHSRLNMYLSHIGITDDPVCKCNDSIETLNHFLFECSIENDNRIGTIQKTCLSQNIRFPPDRKELINNKQLLASLGNFLTN